MNTEYLATGFCDVDGRADAAAYKTCLSLLDSLPYYRKVKQRSYELLELLPGMSVLEIGCGLGDDALRMAELVGPDGKVTGVDSSVRMVETASSRNRDGRSVDFLQADARHLPFVDESFIRCRTDRTLQHIECPGIAIVEMVRVLKHDGILVAYDNNWATFSLSGTDRNTTQRVERRWASAFVNPEIGNELHRYFSDAGLNEVAEYPSVSLVDDFEMADQIYNLRQTVERLVEEGELTRETAINWLADLEQQSVAGRFHCSLTAFTVVGRKG